MSAVTIVDPSTLPVWRTVELGVSQSVPAYIKACPVRIFCDPDTQRALPYLPVSQKRTQIDLIRFKWEALGFNQKFVTYDDICERVAGHGLMKCPAEVPVALRTQYLDQPSMELLMVPLDLPERECCLAEVDRVHRRHGLSYDLQACPDGIAVPDQYDWDIHWVFMRQLARPD